MPREVMSCDVTETLHNISLQNSEENTPFGRIEKSKRQEMNQNSFNFADVMLIVDSKIRAFIGSMQFPRGFETRGNDLDHTEVFHRGQRCSK